MGRRPRCQHRGHRWRVLGFDPGHSGFRALVFLRCTRCHSRITAEIVPTREADR